MYALWADVSTNHREWLTTEYVVNFIFGGFFVFMEVMDIIMEIVGYAGTGLVLISFLMTDLKWLRIVNICGGFLSLVYAIYAGTMPVVVLNGSLITINTIQVMRLSRKEREKAVNSAAQNAYHNTEEKSEE